MAIDIANPGANEAALEAALVQRLPPARLPWVSGRSYGSANVVMVVHAPDYLVSVHATPIMIPNAITIASLSVKVYTPADATTQRARVGIATDVNGTPSQTLFAEGMTELDLTQPGLLTVVLPGAVAAAGWHWLMLFISEAVGGAATGAELICLDYNNSVLGTGFEIGGLSPNDVLNSGVGSLNPAVIAYPNGDYTTYATFQEALTDLGMGWDANTSGAYFPAIAVEVA